jgi:hypothetical protein
MDRRRALAKLSAECFRGELLYLRHDIRSALGEEDAVMDLEAAVAASQKENERLRLQAKRDDLRFGSFSPPFRA